MAPLCIGRNPFQSFEKQNHFRKGENGLIDGAGERSSFQHFQELMRIEVEEQVVEWSIAEHSSFCAVHSSINVL